MTIVDNLINALFSAKSAGERIIVLKAIRDYLSTQGFHVSWSSDSLRTISEDPTMPTCGGR